MTEVMNDDQMDDLMIEQSGVEKESQLSLVLDSSASTQARCFLPTPDDRWTQRSHELRSVSVNSECSHKPHYRPFDEEASAEMPSAEEKITVAGFETYLFGEYAKIHKNFIILAEFLDKADMERTFPNDIRFHSVTSQLVNVDVLMKLNAQNSCLIHSIYRKLWVFAHSKVLVTAGGNQLVSDPPERVNEKLARLEMLILDTTSEATLRSEQNQDHVAQLQRKQTQYFEASMDRFDQMIALTLQLVARLLPDDHLRVIRKDFLNNYHTLLEVKEVKNSCMDQQNMLIKIPQVLMNKRGERPKRSFDGAHSSYKNEIDAPKINHEPDRGQEWKRFKLQEESLNIENKTPTKPASELSTLDSSSAQQKKAEPANADMVSLLQSLLDGMRQPGNPPNEMPERKAAAQIEHHGYDSPSGSQNVPTTAEYDRYGSNKRNWDRIPYRGAEPRGRGRSRGRFFRRY